ncbi:Rha family transcriptional regulator [Bacillus sp. FJAT-45350]|uniref:Rha family transcriptional regulator n=1 Tax=Bacillus sp. FJAT-45350 TaxID=2011014 RepID=UPI000BB91872|nr:Rha family transcriptional regulator [Bacillus sp. FJAT-45350]
MNIIKRDEQLLVDSREIAKMIGREHKEVLAMIDGQEHRDGRIKHIGFLPTISESGLFNPIDFFIESSYKTKGNNKSYKCYLLTRKGCDMVANKMTGEKGVLFTATYVTKFDEMERQLVQPKSQLEVLQGTINQLIQHEKRLDKVEKVVTERITLDHGQQTALHHQIKKRVEQIFPEYEEQYTKNKLYAQLHSHLRRAFQAPKYVFIKSKDFDEAMSWIKSWRPLI